MWMPTDADITKGDVRSSGVSTARSKARVMGCGPSSTVVTAAGTGDAKAEAYDPVAEFAGTWSRKHHGAEYAVARRCDNPRPNVFVLLLGDTPLRVLGFQAP